MFGVISCNGWYFWVVVSLRTIFGAAWQDSKNRHSSLESRLQGRPPTGYISGSNPGYRDVKIPKIMTGLSTLLFGNRLALFEPFAVLITKQGPMKPRHRTWWVICQTSRKSAWCFLTSRRHVIDSDDAWFVCWVKWIWIFWFLHYPTILRDGPNQMTAPAGCVSWIKLRFSMWSWTYLIKNVKVLEAYRCTNVAVWITC